MNIVQVKRNIDLFRFWFSAYNSTVQVIYFVETCIQTNKNLMPVKTVLTHKF